MTRENLIQAIYDNDDMWSCPEYSCCYAEQDNCMKCAESQLAEYEAMIRADALTDIVKECQYLLNCGMGKKKSLEHLIKIAEKTRGDNA